MNNKIFVGGLNYEIDEAELKEVFSRFGTIINLRIVRNPETGSSKGFAFITFTEDSEAQASLELDGQKLKGRFIGVSIAHPPRRR